MTGSDLTPRSLGFNMPPEWARHAATWTSWPFDDELWEGQLEVARRDFAGMIAVIARFEPVILNVRDEDTEADARARLSAAGADLSNITFNRLPLNDVWFRECHRGSRLPQHLPGCLPDQSEPAPDGGR